MKTLLKIQEYSRSEEIELDAEERHTILTCCRNKLGVDRPLSGDQYYITTNSYVGVYNVGRYRIVVEPKISTVNVFKMLCYAYDLARFKDDEASYEQIDELFEYLVMIFLNNLNHLIRSGLFANYVSENADLNYVRGKINIIAMVRKPWLKTKINCDLEDYHADVLENQIIKFTLKRLQSIQFKNSVINRHLVKIQRYFTAISLRNITSEHIGYVQYNVLNAYYQPIHNFCQMILDLVGIHEQVGRRSFHAYSLDMNILFEKYIGRLLREKLDDYLVALQDSQYLDEERGINTKLDIVIYQQGVPKLVLDTKYKTGISASNEDRFQIFAYMSKLNVDGVLLYPEYEITEQSHTFGRNKLYIRTFDLNDADYAALKLVRWIKAVIDAKNQCVNTVQ